MKKKLFATLLAAVMTIASTMTAFAAEVPTSFTQVTYKFNCTTFVAEDTITLAATNDSGWIGLIAEGTTHTVTAAGAFEMTVTFQTDMGGWTADAAKGFANMGYLASANSVANIYELECIEIESVEFEFATPYTALDASSSTANGLPNRWSGVAEGTTVASSAKGSTIVYEVTGQDDAGNDVLNFMVKWAEADFEPETTTPAPTTTATPAPSSSADLKNTKTGDAADYTMVVAMLALAGAGVLYFNKRIITEK